MNDNPNGQEKNADTAELRRQMDNFYLSRFADMGKAIERLQLAFENSLKAAMEIQGNQTRMIDRITTFNEKFIEHDAREGEDRERIIETLQQVLKTLSAHDIHLTRHEENITMLKTWNLLLAGAVGALAAGGTAWIIQHLQTTVR
ncbi:MAG: hypothetical protein P9F19_01395 [Candidatus Contendobacter sp.]|nr:hypothetical protein [Candidatus Contendobacter sp.]MDG4556044.1 hypothetical protein [Candidatus Contendobacter sp.]